MAAACLLAAAGGCAGNSGRTVAYVAHRGESYDAPENTLESVTLAWERGNQYAEIDVHLTKDHQIVVMHDKDTGRTTNYEQVYTIAETEYSVLERLDVGQWKAPKYTGVRIPLLSRILESIPADPDKKLVIEIKPGPEIVPYLKEEILKSGRQSQVIVISFNPDSLTAFREQMPGIAVYFLKSVPEDEKTGRRKAVPYETDLIDMACEKGFDGLDLQYLGITKEFVKKAHRRGLTVWVFTVDDPAAAADMIACGVDGITSNRACRLKEQMSRKP